MHTYVHTYIPPARHRDCRDSEACPANIHTPKTHGQSKEEMLCKSVICSIITARREDMIPLELTRWSERVVFPVIWSSSNKNQIVAATLILIRQQANTTVVDVGQNAYVPDVVGSGLCAFAACAHTKTATKIHTHTQKNHSTQRA